MKKIIVLLFLANLGFAQESAPLIQPPHRYLGLGFKLGAFQTSELMGNFNPVNRLFVSVDPIKYLRLDVQYGMNNSTRNQEVTYPTGLKQTFELDNKNSILQFGAFGTLNLDDMLLFVGFRYGINKGEYDNLRSEWNGTSLTYFTETDKTKGSSLAPVLGAEYRFGNRFAVGAELSYMMMSTKYTPGMPGAQTQDSKMNLIETSAFFRFFPF